MSTVAEIKAATAQLPPAERVDLFKWLAEDPEVRKLQLKELRRDVQLGLDDLDHGRCAVCDEHSLGVLAETIKTEGRKKLAIPG